MFVGENLVELYIYNCTFAEIYGNSVHLIVSLLADWVTAGFRIDNFFDIFCVNAGIMQTSGQACRSDTCTVNSS